MRSFVYIYPYYYLKIAKMMTLIFRINFYVQKNFLKTGKEEEKEEKEEKGVIVGTIFSACGTKRMNNNEERILVEVSKHLSRPGVNKRRRVKRYFAQVAPCTLHQACLLYANTRVCSSKERARFVELYLKRIRAGLFKLSLCLVTRFLHVQPLPLPVIVNNYGIICARGRTKRASCSRVCDVFVRSTVDYEFSFCSPINSDIILETRAKLH